MAALFNAFRRVFGQKFVAPLGGAFEPPPEDGDGNFEYDLDFNLEA